MGSKRVERSVTRTIAKHSFAHERITKNKRGEEQLVNQLSRMLNGAGEAFASNMRLYSSKDVSEALSVKPEAYAPVLRKTFIPHSNVSPPLQSTWFCCLIVGIVCHPS